MPSLLISVRDLQEFQLCLESGVPWIDFKEPDDGALAPTSPSLWKRAIALLESRRDALTTRADTHAAPPSPFRSPRLSAALGELRDLGNRVQTSPGQHFEPDSLPTQGLDFVKLGWAGSNHSQAAVAWQAWAHACAPKSNPVLVLYADYATCQAPAPQDALKAVGNAPCQALLIDTFDKQHGDLFAHLSQREIEFCLDQARSRGWLTVLAGSLRDASLDQAIELEPDVIAVRGAACRGDRRASLDPQKVQNLVEQVLGSGHRKGRTPSQDR